MERDYDISLLLGQRPKEREARRLYKITNGNDKGFNYFVEQHGGDMEMALQTLKINLSSR